MDSESTSEQETGRAKMAAMRTFTGLAFLLVVGTLVMTASASPQRLSTESSAQPTVTHGLQPINHPTQVEALRDGSVSHDEMKQALLRMVDCIEGAGFQAELTTFVPRLRYEIEVTSNPGSADDQEAEDAAYNLCDATYVSLILDAYAKEHGPSEAELKARNAQLLDCMSKKSGVAVQGRTLEEMREAVGDYLLGVCDEVIGLPLD